MEPEPKGTPRRGRIVRRLVASAAAAMVVVGATVYMSAATQAQTPAAEGEYDEAAIRLGFQVWKDKVWCGQCHGWNGNGLPDDPRAPVGANLRETLLTPELFYDFLTKPNSRWLRFSNRVAAKDGRNQSCRIIASVNEDTCPTGRLSDTLSTAVGDIAEVCGIVEGRPGGL